MRKYDIKYWNLLREITLSQFKLKDQSTFFGYVWSFLNPLIMLTVLFAFFRLRIGGEIEHYAIYLLIGIIHYTHFSNSTGASLRVLYSMRHLTCNAVFPKELLVMGSIFASAIEFIISMFISVLIAIATGIHLSWVLLMLPFVIILQIMLVLWVSLLLSCLYVFIRDIDHIYQVFLRILFFLTPIFYGLSFLGEGIAKHIVLSNPLTHLIIFSRILVIEGNLFSVHIFLLFLLINVFLIYVGFRAFKKFEPRFAENL